MLDLIVAIINATPDTLRFALMDAGADDLMRLIADAAGLTYFEDGSIG